MASSKKPQSKFTEAQGIKLHYLEWGETGKPDLLLVHGWTSFASSWSFETHRRADDAVSRRQ